MEAKLETLSQRHDTILSQLSDNSLNPAELTQASKELATLSTPKALFEEWQKSKNDLTELHKLLTNTGDDDEMIELAKEEYSDIMEKIGEVEKNLVTELAPKDMADEANAILEIRSGAGGDEASLFTADMARMYERFAQLQRWKWEILSQSDETGGKGFKDITVNVAGKSVFGLLKYESGVHRYIK